ncbi:AAA family ATPase [Candidatus Saccharibacteria bacterium]|nr:AAA family ATPase [Candidatus Saccharibacteria bacterium]
MTHHDHTKILAFVGLPGCGKSTAVDYFTEKGFPKVYFGGIILQAMKDVGLEHTEENEKAFREEYREKYGKDSVANKIVEQINDLITAGQYRIIADGLYSWSEYKILKHAFPGELTVVAVITPKHLRYHRLSQRPVRPLTESEAKERDWSEIENLEKGGPIAIADYYVINDGSVDEFQQKLAAAATEIVF